MASVIVTEELLTITFSDLLEEKSRWVFIP